MIDRLIASSILFSGLVFYPFLGLVSVILLLVFGEAEGALFYNLMLGGTLLLLCWQLLRGFPKYESWVILVAVPVTIYTVLLCGINVLFSERFFWGDICVIYATAFVFLMSGMLSSMRKNKSNLSLAQINYLLILFLQVGIVVSIIGLLEKSFLNFEEIQTIGFYRLLSSIRGVDANNTPDNLFSMVEGIEYRRLVSVFGEPLYAAYFLYPVAILSYVRVRLVKGSKWIIFGLVCLATLMTLSRYIIIVLLLAIVFFEAYSQRMLRLFLFIMMISLPIILIVIFFIHNYMLQYDISYQGHIDSVIATLNSFNGLSLLAGTEDVFKSNYLSAKSNYDTGSESGALILSSCMGVFAFIFFVGFYVRYLISRLHLGFCFVYRNENNPNLNYKIDLVTSYVVAYPLFSIGYLFTLLFSPHLITFQVAIYFCSLSLLYTNCFVGLSNGIAKNTK